MSGNQRRFHLRHLEDRPHAVYVIWADDVPLYVGMTSDFESRRSVHFSTSLWARYATRWEQIPAPDRGEALALERITIRERMPLFNVSKNPTPTADPHGVLVERLRASLPPEALALREQFEADGDELAYTANVASLFLAAT